VSEKKESPAFCFEKVLVDREFLVYDGRFFLTSSKYLREYIGGKGEERVATRSSKEKNQTV
jgi:hypothetical protein